MNELIFFLHIILVSAVTLLALKISKESLVATIVLFCILANLFVVKQITLFGLNPTASDAFAVGAIVGLNLLQEYFGKQIAQKTVWTCFFALIFYAIISQIHLAYTPSMYDKTSSHFHALLQFMPRIAIASIGATLITQLIDRVFYGYLKMKFANKYFFMRNIISLLLVQAIDTILFSFAGLYGIVYNIWEVIAVSFTVKIVTIAIYMPIISIFRLKKQINGQK